MTQSHYLLAVVRMVPIRITLHYIKIQYITIHMWHAVEIHLSGHAQER